MKKLYIKSSKWWNNLPVQNLYNMNDSWIGYVWKYYPNREGIYGLTDNEILNIWLLENKNELRYFKIKKIWNIK